MMLKVSSLYDFFYSFLLSARVRKRGEVLIISLAVFSFLLHLLLVFLNSTGLLPFTDEAGLFTNPVAAIYTPFSFILIYEVYLMVYYLPKSTTIYIGKQYEIITLILIRNLFKDLAKLEFSPGWFHITNDQQFSVDLVATLILFFLIYVFYRLNQRKFSQTTVAAQLSAELVRFIRIKNIMAMVLIPVFLVLAVYGFSGWISATFNSGSQLNEPVMNLKRIFFDEFFTILILTDVLLLLISFLNTDRFNIVIRNSGFIISTTLMKLSFGLEGLLSTILIVVAVLFGVAMLYINNLFEKIVLPENS